MKVVVIIPTYNEKGNAEKLIRIVEDEVFPKINTYDMHILVADDQSPDGTGEEVKKLINDYKNLHLLSGEKKGLGAAYLRAMDFAIKELSADIMFELDADFFHDPKKIPEFLGKIREGNDFVIGTRYSGGGSIPKNWKFHRKVFSIGANLLIRTIVMRFSIHDWTGGYRAIKKEVFLKEKDKLKGFKGYTFQVAFLYKAILDGYKVAEVPFHATDRILGRSKIAPLEYIINLFMYVIKERLREVMLGKFGKFLVVGGFGFIINAVLYETLVKNTHLSLAASNLIAAQFAIFSNYNFNNLWTFGSQKSKTVFSYFGKMAQFYLTSNTGVFFIQTGTIQLGDMLLGEKYYRIYFIIGTAFLLIWNFTIYNRLIWRRQSPKQ